MKKRILGGIAALLIALGLTAATALPAWAVNTVTVCNGSTSVDDLLLYNDSAGIAVRVRQGECRSISDAGGDARVDVDIGGSEGDVDSWYKKDYYGRYYGCYNNEDGSSNPFSGSTLSQSYTYYKTYSYTGC